MKQYHDLLNHILENGEEKSDRTGVGTISTFGYQSRYNLRDGFPAVTTKKLAWRAVVSELIWFLSGSMDERRLAEIHYEDFRENLIGKKTIWTANADKQGAELGYINTDLIKNLGPIYGYQWRKYPSRSFIKSFGIDQIAEVIDSLKMNPDSRRHLVSAWNVDDIDQMALPPCHLLFQFHVNKSRELSCHMYQRSADAFLGVPFNIASYALLTHIIATICDYKVADLVISYGDLHIYSNHIDAVKLQLSREPFSLPTLKMPKFSTLQEVVKKKPSEFILENYNSHSTIAAPMAV